MTNAYLIEYAAQQEAMSRAGGVKCRATLRKCARTLRCRAENEKIAAKHMRAVEGSHRPFERAAEIVDDWAERASPTHQSPAPSWA